MPDAEVRGLAFSHSGALLAGACADGTTRLWDAASSRQLLRLSVSRASVEAVTFTPDDTTVVSGGDGLTFWDTCTGLAAVRRHAAPVGALALSADGMTLACGNDDRTIRLWNTATRSEILRLEGYAGLIYGLAFTPDGKTLASSSTDGTVRLWNLHVGQEVGTLTGHTSTVDGIAFSPDGNTLASAGGEGTVRLWRAVPFAETDNADPLLWGRTVPAHASRLAE